MWFSFTPPDIRTHCARCRKNSHKRSGTTSSLPTPTPYISQFSPHIMNNREEAKNTRNKILFCKFSNGVSCLNSCNYPHYLQSMTLRFPVASCDVRSEIRMCIQKLRCAFRSCDVHSEVAMCIQKLWGGNGNPLWLKLVMCICVVHF